MRLAGLDALTPPAFTADPSDISVRRSLLTGEGTTPGQKAALIKGATDRLRDVLSKPPSLAFVVIQEVDRDDWGVDGLPVAEHGRRATAGSTG
jgi:4-oxalocrotonate tautomerase